MGVKIKVFVEDMPPFMIGDTILFTTEESKKEIKGLVNSIVENDGVKGNLTSEEVGLAVGQVLTKHCLVGKLRSRTDDYVVVENVKACQIAGGEKHDDPIHKVPLEHVVGVLGDRTPSDDDEDTIYSDLDWEKE